MAVTSNIIFVWVSYADYSLHEIICNIIQFALDKICTLKHGRWGEEYHILGWCLIVCEQAYGKLSPLNWMKGWQMLTRKQQAHLIRCTSQVKQPESYSPWVTQPTSHTSRDLNTRWTRSMSSTSNIIGPQAVRSASSTLEENKAHEINICITSESLIHSVEVFVDLPLPPCVGLLWAWFA